MDILNNNDFTEISGFGEINLDLTLDCGQAFRWKKEGGLWKGVAFGKSISVKSENGVLFINGADAGDIKNIWENYFDLNRDYKSVLDEFSADAYVKKAIENCGTVRILNQEPWEALCSFIISACNNIPRIKGIVTRLCEGFGEELPDGSFTFPSAETIASKTVDDLAFLRSGYRAPFIIDAARKTASKEVDLNALKELTVDEARKELMKINGVGRKVADCTLLFSLGFSSVFPVDRHIKRACDRLYPNGLPECFSSFAGLAQQYIFNEQRNS